MEKLDLGSLRSQVKVVATFVCISGALIVIFYQGPPIFSLHSLPDPTAVPSITAASSWLVGGLLLAIAGLSMSIFNILSVVSLMAEKYSNAWKLQADIQLVSVVYSAILGNVVTFCVVSWCIQVKGPVFVAMFKPLSIAIASFMGVLFLGDTLHLGSVIGAVVTVTGFYGVIGAQSGDNWRAESSSSVGASLLDNYDDGV